MWETHGKTCALLALLLIAAWAAACFASDLDRSAAAGSIDLATGVAASPRGPIPATATKAKRGYSADGGISDEEPGLLFDPYQVGYILVVNPLKEPLTIRIDDRDYGTIPSGEYATFLVRPGENQLQAVSERGRLIRDSLHSKPGQLVYYDLGKGSVAGSAAKENGK